MKKKLAIISSTDYRSYPMGGMMSFIVDILPYLNKDFDITLWGVSSESYEKSEIKLHGRSYPLKTFSTVKLVRKMIPNMLKVIFYIRLRMNEILSEKYDILYFHGIPLSFPFLKKKKAAKFPKIINHIHGITNPFAMNRSKLIRNKLMVNLYHTYRKRVVLYSDLILLAADNDAHEKFLKEFNNSLSNKIGYIPNFANTKIFRSLNKIETRTKLDLSHNANIFVTTGRLSFQKDPFLLLEAFSFLKKSLNVSAQLFIIGDGELRKDLEEKIRKMNLSSDVKMLGSLERKEIALWLNAADIFIYTSKGNGFPVSLVEAALCGLPVVSTDVTGVHDIVIDGKTGYLAKTRHPEEIANLVKNTLKNKEKFSKNILELSHDFTPEHIAKKIKDLFYKIT